MLSALKNVFHLVVTIEPLPVDLPLNELYMFIVRVVLCCRPRLVSAKSYFLVLADNCVSECLVFQPVSHIFGIIFAI